MKLGTGTGYYKSLVSGILSRPKYPNNVTQWILNPTGTLQKDLRSTWYWNCIFSCCFFSQSRILAGWLGKLEVGTLRFKEIICWASDDGRFTSLFQIPDHLSFHQVRTL